MLSFAWGAASLIAALTLASLGYALETGRVVLHGSGPELLANAYIRRTYLGA